MTWRPYWKTLTSAAHEDSANPRQIAASVGLSLFRIFLLSAIYAVAYRFGHAGLRYQNAIWSLAVYFAFNVNLGLRDIFKVAEQDVRSGEIEQQLTKPVDWRLIKICQVAGKNCLEFLLQLAVMPVFLWVLVGRPDVAFWSPSFLLEFAGLCVLAVVATSSLFMTIGLAAFWLNDAQSVSRLLDRIVLIFGGGFVPLALLPPAVQAAVRYSPFGVYAAPTQLFNPAIAPVLTMYIAAAAGWTTVLFGLNTVVWRRAQRRIEVNGG